MDWLPLDHPAVLGWWWVRFHRNAGHSKGWRPLRASELLPLRVRIIEDIEEENTDDLSGLVHVPH